MDTEIQAAASRLCQMCGMCCNGALFQSVVLQPGDSEKEVEAAKLKLERQKAVVFFRQPCSALDGCRCSVYEQRPARCREFVCVQIQQLEAGEITEEEARATIETAADLYTQVNDLLVISGDENRERPLLTRYHQVSKEPVRLEAMKTRAKLMVAVDAFVEILEEDFRS